MATNHDRPSRLRFSDGMEFDVSGDLRVVHQRDGWYVVGRGMLIPLPIAKKATAWWPR